MKNFRAIITFDCETAADPQTLEDLLNRATNAVKNVQLSHISELHSFQVFPATGDDGAGGSVMDSDELFEPSNEAI